MNQSDHNARRLAAQAQESENTLLFIAVALIAAVLIVFNFLVLPEAHSATNKGRLDICAIEVPKSWTKGLQKKANRAFSQRVKVVRTNEWKLADQPCDVTVWTSGDRRTVILSDAHTAEWEVTAKASRKSQRPGAIVKALKTAIPR